MYTPAGFQGAADHEGCLLTWLPPGGEHVQEMVEGSHVKPSRFHAAVCVAAEPTRLNEQCHRLAHRVGRLAGVGRVHR